MFFCVTWFNGNLVCFCLCVCVLLPPPFVTVVTFFLHEYWRAGSWITGAYYYCSTCSFFFFLCFSLYDFSFFFFHSISLPPPHRFFFLIFVFLRLIVLSLVAAALIAHLYVYTDTHTQKVHTHTFTLFNQHSPSFFFFHAWLACLYVYTCFFVFISCCGVYLLWCGECFFDRVGKNQRLLIANTTAENAFLLSKENKNRTRVFFSVSVCMCVCELCERFSLMLRATK